MSPRLVALGECMVELSPAGDGLYRRGFAGDSFNTAWYLRRLLPPDWSVAYGTGIGTDELSERMLAFMAAAGIATEGVRRIAGRTVGLYAIDLREGERSFTYWRGESAARLLAASEADLARMIEGARLVYFSGITLAILPADDRPRLLAALARARAGGSLVAFDPNLRPVLWPDAATMRACVHAAAEGADIVLPSFDDEAGGFGDADPAATVSRYRARGAGTVVVKNGSDPLNAWDRREGACSHAPRPAPAVDTTAAGDAFNAGFLAARLLGAPLDAALGEGARVSAIVVGARGALVEKSLIGPPAAGRN